MKITKKLLNDYQKYKREILFLQTELKELLTTDAGLDSNTRRQKLCERRKNMLECRKKQVEAVEQFILDIEDGETRRVFRMRYIDGSGWAEIAKKTGYSGREDYVRRHIRDRTLEKFKIL